MFTKDFDFNLPEYLIAQNPSDERGDDKLLLLNRSSGSIIDSCVSQLVNVIPSNALMLFNNSKVRRARIYGKSEAGGINEFLLIKQLDSEGFIWQAMTKRAKKQKIGKKFIFEDGTFCEIVNFNIPLDHEFRALKFNHKIDDVWLNKNGHIPLPPYIRREDTKEDDNRYQTVYAQNYGSIACPTAGLHFTHDILYKLKEKGVQIEYITLHVGLGTFLPIRTEKIEDHKMHTETFFISDATAEAVENAKKENRPIIAVGTTTVRTVESAWDEKTCSLKRGSQSTNIFIYPPYNFKVVDMLFTNFHTPQSSLVMLVSAFAGKENIFNAYSHAIEKKYRFFSYGDAMFIGNF